MSCYWVTMARESSSDGPATRNALTLKGQFKHEELKIVLYFIDAVSAGSVWICSWRVLKRGDCGWRLVGGLWAMENGCCFFQRMGMQQTHDQMKNGSSSAVIAKARMVTASSPVQTNLQWNSRQYAAPSFKRRRSWNVDLKSLLS